MNALPNPGYEVHINGRLVSESGTAGPSTGDLRINNLYAMIGVKVAGCTLPDLTYTWPEIGNGCMHVCRVVPEEKMKMTGIKTDVRSQS